jgi:hypothetical protein
MTKYPFNDEFFRAPSDRPDDWPDDPEVRAAVEWLKSFLRAGEWKARRAAAADHFYDAALQRLPDRKGRFFKEADTFGWYLFLGEAFIDHIWNYEPVFGSRVVPLFQAIGRDLPRILEVEGIVGRVQRLIGAERAQPNGGLFELLVAAAYRRAGAKVRFVPERPGVARTHDMDVDLNGVSWAVECKRMEVGQYGEREREIIRERWGPLASVFAEQGENVLGEARFRTPLEAMPEDYLRQRAIRFISDPRRLPILWDDAFSAGFIRTLDLRPLREVLKTDIVLAGSSRLIQLLTGQYIRHAPYNSALRLKFADNPRYIEDCDCAVLFRWESGSEVAIDAKARDILKKVAEATDQLPSDRPGVVHIGFEAVEGDRVEQRRQAKILKTVSEFDAGEKPLQYVYTHYMVPESPPDEAWAYDETTQWIGVKAALPPPVAKMFTVLPRESAARSGPHWRQV